MTHRKFFRRALPLLLALSLAAPAFAQDQPQPKPIPIARFSFASIDALTKLLADLGIPALADLKSNIENSPFLGTNTVATDKPFGFVLIAGDSQKMFPLPNSLMIAMPVLPGKATPDDLTKAGGKPVAGQPNVVNFDTFFVRRTPGYIFVKDDAATPFGLSIADETVFAPEYKQPGTIAAFAFNVDSLRKSAPEAYKDFAQNITDFPMMFVMGPGLAAAAPANPEAAKPVLAVLDKIDRLTVTLAQDDKSFHLKSWLVPTPFTTKTKEAARPAFPAGVIAQLHFVFPDAAAAGFLEQKVAALPEDLFAELPPVYHDRVREVLTRLAHLSTESDAVSLAFTLKDGRPILYVVDQLSQQTDALTEFKSIITDASALATESGAAKINLDSATYDAAGKKVQHLVLAADGIPEKLVIDGIQSGKTLYLALSDNPDGKFVADLAAAGMNGSSTVLCAGVIDLGAAVQAMTDSGGIPGLTTPDKLEALKKTFAGQGITWTVQSSDQNFLFTDLAVPTNVIKDVIKMIGN